MALRFLPIMALLALAAGAPAHAQSGPVATADISVAMTATDAQTAPSRGPFVSPVTYTVTVTNAGPAEANTIHLGIELTGKQDVQEVTSDAGRCTTAATTIMCDIATIAPGRAEVVQVRTLPASTSDLGARANATSFSTDPRPNNNFAAATPEIVVIEPQPPGSDTTPPDTRIVAPRARERVGTFRRFRGTASDTGTGVDHVEIAVQRTDGGCRALTGPSVRFGPPRSCGARTWLPAAGTTSWRYNLKRALPKGRYRVYSRATDRSNQTENAWSKADGNVVRFTVR